MSIEPSKSNYIQMILILISTMRRIKTDRQELMTDPYILCETGVSYEHQHIKDWIRTNG